jgi:hypothetical protein
MSNLIMAFDAPFNNSAPGYKNWEQYEQANVSGVTLMYPWNSIEHSEGSYDFSEIDSRLSKFPGKKVALVLAPQSFTTTSYTPSYVVNQTPKDQMVSCSQIAGSAIVPWSAEYSVAYNNFVKAAISHYNTANAPKLSYLRIGFFRGGQSSLQCPVQLEQLAGGAAPLKAVWLDAYAKLISTIFASNPTFPVQLEVSDGPAVDTSYAIAEAKAAVGSGVGIGCEGFQPGDMSGGNSSGDWVNLFKQYASNPIIRELQPLTTGYDLSKLLPFAAANHANVVELQMAYVAEAFDPGGNKTFATAIVNFIEGK